SQAISDVKGRSLGVLVLDVKNLRRLNDSFGRSAGDLVLQLAAERLKNHFGQSRCLAHLGGGTYAAVEDEIEGRRDRANEFMRTVHALFDAPFDVMEQDVQLSIRAGMALYPDDGEEANALLTRAETALAHAKDTGED